MSREPLDNDDIIFYLLLIFGTLLTFGLSTLLCLWIGG